MGGGRLATRMGYREFSGSAAASVRPAATSSSHTPPSSSLPSIPPFAIFQKLFLQLPVWRECVDGCSGGGACAIDGWCWPPEEEEVEGGRGEKGATDASQEKKPRKKRPQAARVEGKSQVRQGEVDNDLLLLWPSFVFGKWRESSRLGGVGRVRPPLLYAPSSSLFA